MRLALVAVLVMAAFAHRPASLAPGGMSLIELSRYVLPDGSLPSWCLPDDQNGASGHGCAFCLIASGAAPPGPWDGCGTPWQHAEHVERALTLAHGPVRAPLLRSAPPRGPPLAAG